MSWDFIIPFLKPIEPFLRDPEVTDILVNGSGRVFVERAGVMTEAAGVTVSNKSLSVAVRNIARILGDDVNEETPILEARLPDGSRLAAVLEPCSVGGTSIAIRKFQNRRYDVRELVRVGTFTPPVLDLLAGAVTKGDNILISGRTGAGKTTVLNALAGLFGEHERAVVIEDTPEIEMHLPNLVRLEARRAQPGLPAVTIQHLLRTTLRLKPDRIVVGEIRGEEAFDWLQALNTGHRGSLSTTHAESAALSLERVTTCVLMAEKNLPYTAIKRQIGLGLQVLVHLGLEAGKRRVLEVVRVHGFDLRRDDFNLEVLYAA